MKRYLLIVLALCLSVGVSDLSAQSFLKKLGKTVKKEVVDRAKKETKKETKKVTKKDFYTSIISTALFILTSTLTVLRPAVLL